MVLYNLYNMIVVELFLFYTALIILYHFRTNT